MFHYKFESPEASRNCRDKISAETLELCLMPEAPQLSHKLGAPGIGKQARCGKFRGRPARAMQEIPGSGIHDTESQVTTTESYKPDPEISVQWYLYQHPKVLY